MSKTPIADKVRNLEFELIGLKEAQEEVIALRTIVKESDKAEYALNDTMLTKYLTVSKAMYLTVLKGHLNNVGNEIVKLESKLSTVYAAVNDCLGE